MCLSVIWKYHPGIFPWVWYSMEFFSECEILWNFSLSVIFYGIFLCVWYFMEYFSECGILWNISLSVIFYGIFLWVWYFMEYFSECGILWNISLSVIFYGIFLWVWYFMEYFSWVWYSIEYFYDKFHIAQKSLFLLSYSIGHAKFIQSLNIFLQEKMGYKKGTGLGKNAQGRVNIVEASTQRGRRGLGLTLPGLEPSMEAEWDEESDQVNYYI